MSQTTNKFFPEVRERAARLALDGVGPHGARWQAIVSISAKIGCSASTLAEAINGLFKAEVIHRRGPWRSFEAVEHAALERVDRFNNRRLPEPIGNIPPVEAGANFYAAPETDTNRNQPPANPARFKVVPDRRRVQTAVVANTSWRYPVGLISCANFTRAPDLGARIHIAATLPNAVRKIPNVDPPRPGRRG
jgi:DNA-binding Lrp family transcriptional regulator